MVFFQLAFDNLKVQDIATTLLIFIRELKEPIFTEKLMKFWLKVGAIEEVTAKRRVVFLLLMLLPRNHITALLYLLHFLSSIAANYKEHGISSHTLATIFGPHLLRQRHNRLRRKSVPWAELNHSTSSTSLPNVPSLPGSALSKLVAGQKPVEQDPILEDNSPRTLIIPALVERTKEEAEIYDASIELCMYLIDNAKDIWEVGLHIYCLPHKIFWVSHCVKTLCPSRIHVTLWANYAC